MNNLQTKVQCNLLIFLFVCFFGGEWVSRKTKVISGIDFFGHGFTYVHVYMQMMNDNVAHYKGKYSSFNGKTIGCLHL